MNKHLIYYNIKALAIGPHLSFLKLHGGLGRWSEENYIISHIYFFKCNWKPTKANHHKNHYQREKSYRSCGRKTLEKIKHFRQTIFLFNKIISSGDKRQGYFSSLLPPFLFQ